MIKYILTGSNIIMAYLLSLKILNEGGGSLSIIVLLTFLIPTIYLHYSMAKSENKN